MSQPDYYPMTLAALTAACNQKSNRNPVMALRENEVQTTLEVLRQKSLVSFVVPPPGSRNMRYKHEIPSATGWGPRQQAIMTELLLRGPQTVGELRTRCARLFSFEDLQAVTTTLESLMHDDPPAVRVLPREPGQSAIRYTHLLYPEDEQPTVTKATLAAETSQPSPATMPAEELKSQIDQLQKITTELRQQLSDMNARLAAIEKQLS
jgi:uncharacterized protein YceH (UPF0502 family)